MLPKEIQDIIKLESQVTGISAQLIEAIIMVESSGNPKVSDRYEPGFYKKYMSKTYYNDRVKKAMSTSYGMMQIMGATARELGYEGRFEDLRAPEIGIHWGCKCLRAKMARYKELDDAIAAYNAGSARKNEDGRYVNQGYVNKVHEFLKSIQEEGG